MFLFTPVLPIYLFLEQIYLGHKMFSLKHCKGRNPPPANPLD